MSAIIANNYGIIEISSSVFANLVGFAATGCYGVVGMSNKSKTDGIVRLLKKDSIDKGVKVTLDGQKVYVDLHIMVEYGINIPVICESIINRVKYYIQSTTGFEVESVNVNVDGMRVD